MSNKNESHIKNIITLSSAPLFSQILGFILTPIITRLYSPEDFGFLNLFSSRSLILLVFFLLKLLIFLCKIQNF